MLPVNYPALTDGASCFYDDLLASPQACIRIVPILLCPSSNPFSALRGTRLLEAICATTPCLQVGSGKDNMGLKQKSRKKSPFIPYLTEGDFSAKRLNPSHR